MKEMDRSEPEPKGQDGSERAWEVINSPDYQDITDLIDAEIPMEEWPDECFLDTGAAF